MSLTPELVQQLGSGALARAPRATFGMSDTWHTLRTLLGAPGIGTRSKDATRGSRPYSKGHRYKRSNFTNGTYA